VSVLKPIRTSASTSDTGIICKSVYVMAGMVESNVHVCHCLTFPDCFVPYCVFVAHCTPHFLSSNCGFIVYSDLS